METKEAIRVAFACALDRARELPAGKTKERVKEACRVLANVKPWIQERDPTCVLCDAGDEHEH